MFYLIALSFLRLFAARQLSSEDVVVVKFGSNLGETIPQRVLDLLHEASVRPIVLSQDEYLTSLDIIPSLAIYLGDVTAEYISDNELQALDFEGNDTSFYSLYLNT